VATASICTKFDNSHILSTIQDPKLAHTLSDSEIEKALIEEYCIGKKHSDGSQIVVYYFLLDSTELYETLEYRYGDQGASTVAPLYNFLFYPFMYEGRIKSEWNVLNLYKDYFGDRVFNKTYAEFIHYNFPRIELEPIFLNINKTL
jgi:hypothetical protein